MGTGATKVQTPRVNRRIYRHQRRQPYEDKFVRILQGGKRADVPKTSREAVSEVLLEAQGRLEQLAETYGESWILLVARAQGHGASVVLDEG